MNIGLFTDSYSPAIDGLTDTIQVRRDLADVDGVVRDCLDGDRETDATVEQFSVSDKTDALESICGVAA